MKAWQKIMITLPLSILLAGATVIGASAIGAIVTPGVDDGGIFWAAMLGLAFSPFVFAGAFALCWFFKAARIVIAVLDLVVVLAVSWSYLKAHKELEERRQHPVTPYSEPAARSPQG